MSKNITMTEEQLKAIVAEAVAEAKAKDKDDDEFQPVWRKDEKDYATGIIMLPDGSKVWLNIFPNKYWDRKKGKKGERPMFHVTVNPYTPKEKDFSGPLHPRPSPELASSAPARCLWGGSL